MTGGRGLRAGIRRTVGPVALGVLMLLWTSACEGPDGARLGETAAEAVVRSPGAPDVVARHDGRGDPAPARHRVPDAAPASGLSIYHAESTWTDQAGRERLLASLAGKPRLVAMLYTSCAHACPRIMLDLKRIEGELGPRADDVGFVIVSIDPERDTPDRLAEFARGSRLDPARWTLLSGDEDEILELAALLGVQYRRTNAGEFVHSNLISVLDPAGVIVHRQQGLGTDPAETLAVLRSLME